MFTTEITFTEGKAGRAYERGMKSIAKLAMEIADLIEAGNEQGLLSGMDASGEAMAPLSPNTRNRGGDGPPLVPRESGSRFVKNFRVRYQILKGRLRFRCYWVRISHFARYHDEGTRHMPRRNPAGIRPQDLRRITSAVDRHFNRSAEFSIQTDIRTT